MFAVSPVVGAGEDASHLPIRHEACELRWANAYEAGKVPVVFVHGLLGSPGNWSTMIDRLSADPAIRARFQFATFRYDSLSSILESGLRLAETLDRARRQLDPDGRDRAWDQVVLVGHSLGGLVIKATSRAVDPRRLELVGTRSQDGGPSRVPRAQRFIFIATPHRGTPVDQGALRVTGIWLARALQSRTAAIAGQLSSIDELTWEHPLLGMLEQTRIADGTPFHSIIAALGDPSIDGASDGVVPVQSARLVGAWSELMVRTHHLCLDHPEVIGTVRKILIEDDARRAAPAPDRAVPAASAAAVSLRMTAPATGRPVRALESPRAVLGTRSRSRSRRSPVVVDEAGG